jgi:hypothetical protein
MAIASGSYGYVVVKSEWLLHDAVQLLLQLKRNEVAQARSTGYHMLEARVLDDATGSGLLAEIEIPRPNRNGDSTKIAKAQVVIPWSVVITVAIFSQEDFGEMRKTVGFRPADG